MFRKSHSDEGFRGCVREARTLRLKPGLAYGFYAAAEDVNFVGNIALLTGHRMSLVDPIYCVL